MKMNLKIRIKTSNHEFLAELFNTPTGEEIYKSLPISAKAITWGKEIYFSIPVCQELETDSRDILEVGELGYYPPLQAFCIFFGPTPVSTDNKPIAAGDVNVFGKIISNISELNYVQVGDTIDVVPC